MNYKIQIPSWWWEWKYPGFEQYSGKRRKEIEDYEFAEFEKQARSEELKKEYQGWTIEPIDNNNSIDN